MTAKNARRWLLPIIAAAIIAADQLTKWWIRSALPPGGSIPLVDHLAFTYVQNTGSAFGFFHDRGLIISIVGIVAVILMLVFYRYLSPFNMLGLVSLSLVFGGAVGNLIDRFSLGFVTDFIEVRLWGNTYWPNFNVADSCISIGGLMLIYFFFTVLRKGERHGAGRDAPNPTVQR